MRKQIRVEIAIENVQFAELESILGDTDRARSIYELAIEQPRLDMPELLWKAFIDFEIEQQEYDRARRLYSKLLKKTQHVKVKLTERRFCSKIIVRFRFGLVWHNSKRRLKRRMRSIVHEIRSNKLIKHFEQPQIKKNV